MPDTVFLVNPGGGRGRTGGRLDQLRRLAGSAGAALEISRDVADLELLARQAVAGGARRLLVAGGDGTLHHALQALACAETALGILPLGSGNDLAGALGVPAQLEAAVELALTGSVRTIDLGAAGGRVFGGVAGLGFDSEVNRYANTLRRLTGSLVYVWAVLRKLGGFRPPRVEIEFEGAAVPRFSGPVMFVALANSPRYGGGMRIAPAARLDDGRLDCVVVRAISRAALLRVFPAVFRGAHVHHPAVAVVRAAAATLRLTPALTSYGDGEPLVEVGERGVRFAIMPGALRVMAP
jgi:diacylglycerol kinase (ATP)